MRWPGGASAFASHIPARLARVSNLAPACRLLQHDAPGWSVGLSAGPSHPCSALSRSPAVIGAYVPRVGQRVIYEPPPHAFEASHRARANWAVRPTAAQTLRRPGLQDRASRLQLTSPNPRELLD